MKKISILIVGLFLTLQSLPLYSEESNTKEFSIEGIRIGDRADDHFTGRELAMAISNEFNHLSNIGFYVHNFRNKKPINNYDYAFKEYDYVRIITKQDDGRLFYIHGVTALMRYEDINDCYSKHDKLVKELSSNQKVQEVTTPPPDDPKNTVTEVSFADKWSRVMCLNKEKVLVNQIFSTDALEWIAGRK